MLTCGKVSATVTRTPESSQQSVESLAVVATTSAWAGPGSARAGPRGVLCTLRDLLLAELGWTDQAGGEAAGCSRAVH